MKSFNLLRVVACMLLFCWSMQGAAQTSPTYGNRFQADVKMKYVYSMDEALRLAKKQNKPVFFNCFVDWAVPCHVMNVKVFSDSAFCDYMNRTFVNLFIDLSTDEGRALRKKFSINQFATFLVLNEKGEEQHRIVGCPMLPQFKAYVDLALSPKTSLAGTRKIYQRGDCSREEMYAYLRALDISSDEAFPALADEYIKGLQLSDYTQSKNWMFVFQAMKKPELGLYEYMLRHKTDFLKNIPVADVNIMLEYVLFPRIMQYASGDVPYDVAAVDKFAEEMNQAALADTCSTKTLYQMARLRGEKKYHELFQFLRERGQYLYVYRTNLEMSLKLPDMTATDRRELVAYLHEAAEREKGSPMQQYLLDFAKQMEGDSEGMKFTSGTFSEVLQKAQQEKKLVFMDCYTAWCGPCRLMASNVFTRQDVGEYLNAHFVNVKYDMEKGEGIELAKKYEVTAFPTLLFLDAQGKVLKKVVGKLSHEDFLRVAQEVVFSITR